MIHNSLDNESESGGGNTYDRKRNEAIFKNMTFDSQGNPMNVQCPDAEKNTHNQIFPRYRLSKKVTTGDE